MPTPRKRRRPARKTTTAARRKPKAEKSDEEVYQDFLNNSGIKELAMRLRVLEAQRQAMGLVPNDRELLKCPRCGLFEGEDDNGALFTRQTPDTVHDTGLRFEKLTDGRWLCPRCCAKVVEPEYKPPPDFWDHKPKK